MFKNIRNKHLKYIYKIRNFILSLKKKKIVLRIGIF